MSVWWQQFEAFLATDPRDVGCDEAVRIMHVYAELVTQGADARSRFPGVAAHLAACGPCAEDVRGLVALLREEARPDTAS